MNGDRPAADVREFSLASYCSARSRERYMVAVAAEGLAFTALRTPPRSLPRDDRGFVILPPAQLFDSEREEFIAQILAGDETALWEAGQEANPEVIMESFR